MRNSTIVLLLLLTNIESFAQKLELVTKVGFLHEQVTGSAKVGEVKIQFSDDANAAIGGFRFRFSRGKLVAEIGVEFSQHYFGYTASGLFYDDGQLRWPLMKAGAVGGKVWSFPVTVQYRLNNYCRILAGINWRMTNIEEQKQQQFYDMPAYSEPFNAVQNSLNASLLYVCVGAGVDWKRFGLDIELFIPTESITSSLTINNELYLFDTENVAVSACLSYRFALFEK